MTIKSVAFGAIGLFLGWVMIMALVMRFSDAAPAAVVILPNDAFLKNLPEAAVLARSSVSITLKDDAPGFAARLYAAGAWLVLPAGLTGCLPLPKSAKQAG